MRRSYCVAAIVAIICGVAGACTLRAQGTDWEVTLTSGEKIDDADIAGLRGDTLLVARLGFMRAVPCDSVIELHRDDGSHWIAGTFLGAGVGIITAALAPYPGDSGILLVITLPGGALLGGVAGGLIGSTMRAGPTYKLSAMTPRERQEELGEFLHARHQDSVVAMTGPRNNFYVEGLGNAVFYSINYEFMFEPNLAGRIGLSYLPKGLLVPMMLNYLFFRGIHHIEVGGGIVTTTIDGGGMMPTMTIGYRLQLQKPGALFRFGFSFPLVADEAGGIFEKGAPLGFSLGYTFN